MVIVTSLPQIFGFDAFTIWPFIFITKKYSTNVPLVEHEKVHYKEQRDVFLFPWLLLYRLSAKFRFNAEVRGHAVQVKLGGVTLKWAAWHIATKYNTGRTVEQAEYALTQQLSKIS